MEKEESKESINEPSTAAPAAAITTWKKLFGGKNHKTGGLDIFKTIKYIYPVTIFIIIAILFWVMSFLYTNVYLTMSQAVIVSNLKSRVIEESVNFDKFNEIEKKIISKNNLSDWPYLNYLASPFAYGAKITYPTGSSTPALKQQTTTTTKSTSTKY